MSRWDAVEADLHSEYGIDAGAGVLRRRTGRWLRTRLLGLLASDTRLSRAVTTSEPKTEPSVEGW